MLLVAKVVHSAPFTSNDPPSSATLKNTTVVEYFSDGRETNVRRLSDETCQPIVGGYFDCVGKLVSLLRKVLKIR